MLGSRPIADLARTLSCCPANYKKTGVNLKPIANLLPFCTIKQILKIALLLENLITSNDCFKLNLHEITVVFFSVDRTKLSCDSFI